MKERRYLAVYDDGHDYGEFFFYSSHRNGSKANMEDAKNTFARKYGWKRARQVTIGCIQRWAGLE